MSTQLFSQIEQVVPTMHGWCSVEKAHALASMILALRPEIVVEIGVWGGRSFIPMALALKEVGRGTAIGVDPWSSQASAIGQDAENEKWWGHIAPHEDVFQNFMKHVRELGLESCVHVIRQSSNDYTPPSKIGLLHIDGNHGPQAIHDVERYGPNVIRGGLCVMDDLNWSGGNVLRASAKLKELGFRELYPLGTGAVYQRC